MLTKPVGDRLQGLLGPVAPSSLCVARVPFSGSARVHVGVMGLLRGIGHPSTVLGVMGARISETPTNPYNTDKSVADTIQVMKQLAIETSHTPEVMNAIHQATKGLSTTATDNQILRAIYYWIKQKVQFVEDEQQVHESLGLPIDIAMDRELLIAPNVLLQMPQPQGDCDDFSTLLAAMLLGLGFNVAFVTIAAEKMYPESLSHVYVKVWYSGNNGTPDFMYMDCSHGNYPGWEYQDYTRKVEWGIN